jgi:diguanylate cyclase (GGDEF)-like protein
MTDSNPQNNIQASLAALTAAVSRKLPEKVAKIRQTWEAIKGALYANEKPQVLHKLAHTLAGTSATYGFEEIADASRQLEHATAPDKEAVCQQEIEQLIVQLEALCVKASANQSATSSIINTIAAPVTTDKPTANLVYLVDDDRDFLLNIALHLKAFGYRVECFSDLRLFDQAVTQLEPAVVIMDVMFANQGNAGIEHIALLNSKRLQPLTTIFITGSNDLLTRLSAVRAQGVAYFTKPVLVEQLVDALDRLTHQVDDEPYRIVIVDDSEEQAHYTALLLQQAGMQTREVNGPLDLLKVLAEYPADLILMDLYMPDCTGIELSKVIRQMDNYLGIPIVFLSAEQNLDKKLGALSMGGDDFLTKPVEPWHLLSVVNSRAERSRLIRRQADTDGLTGLLNHSKSKERLTGELSRAIRESSPLSIAMLDVDHFKKVNDTYGHPAGDRVLKSLANMLKQRLRRYDIIGRYGGEEFLIILPNTDESMANEIMDKLRVSFSELLHHYEKGGFSCQFSCGIASYPTFGTATELINKADKALYVAKNSGRNCVIIADSSSK